jgi:hypothetical protein
MVGYWRRASTTYEPAFQRFVASRLEAAVPAGQ